MADELAEFCVGVIAGQLEAGGLEGGEEALEAEAEANADPTPAAPAAPQVAEGGDVVPFDGGVTVGSITLNGVGGSPRRRRSIRTPPRRTGRG